MLSTQRFLFKTHQYAKLVLLLIVSLLLVATPAVAADKNVSAAQQAYQKERAACQSAPDRKACLRDAGAAFDAAKHGQLRNGDAALYEKNALMRCNALPDADRQDCVRRVHGEGEVSGSVKGGGIFRETKTIIADPPVPAPAEPMYPNMPAGSAPR